MLFRTSSRQKIYTSLSLKTTDKTDETVGAAAAATAKKEKKELN